MPQRSDTVYRSALADRLALQSLTPQQRPIQSTGEGLANMGSMLAQAWGAKNLRQGVNEDSAARAQELARALAGGDPEKEAQLSSVASTPEGFQALQGAYVKNLMPEKPVEQFEPVTDPNGNIIGQRSTISGKVVTDPRSPKLLSDAEVAQQMQIRAAGKPETRIDLKLPPQQTKEAETVGKFFGEQFVDLQKGASSARAQNANLDQLDRLLDRVSTGTGTETGLAVQKLAQRLGINVDIVGDTGSAEAGQAVANEMALQLRNPAGGAGMPGAMSDKDREFLQSMVPGLGQTKEGRKLLVSARKKVNQRNIEVARMARDYRQKHGQVDEGFGAVLDQHAQANPLFTDEDFSGMQKAAAPATSAEAYPEGTIIRNPTTNERLQMKGGQWVPFGG